MVPVLHETSVDLKAAYEEAYKAAQPDTGRSVVNVDLESGEFDWEFEPGRRTRAWGFNGQVPALKDRSASIRYAIIFLFRPFRVRI